MSQQRNELQKELTEFEDKVRTLALSLYSTTSPDSPRLQEARRLFELGDLESANRVLNPDDLERDKDLLENAETFLDQKKQILAQEYLTKAQLLALNKNNPDWFSDARYYYTEALAIHESYDTCFSAAKFLAEQNQFSQAIQYIELMLKYAIDDSQKATTLNYLAISHQNTQQLARAEEEYTEALNIRRILAEKNPSAFQINLATTLLNLGLFYQKNVPNKEKSLDYSNHAI